jgi:hypothetical protein
MHRILLSPLPVRSGGCIGEGTVVGHSDLVIGRLAMIRQAIMSGARGCCGRFFAALHESRRTQATIERARYRHLIYDVDTGLHFGADRRQAPLGL